MVQNIMLEAIRNVIESIPLALVGFIGPPAFWARAAWASGFLKTYRHGMSGLLSVFAGLLLAASFSYDNAAVPILLVAAGVTMVVMFLTMLWPPKPQPPKRTVR